MSDPGHSGDFELTKNASIPVTIDDLNEGLIVVSFSHRDNLYQGVLLQLNRERGIPAGISFPKDYCTGEGKKEGEKDPTQVPPLKQRHTYFQENGTGCRTLRRVIKPPARFKNSRMSLRPVQRPILCAKCGSQCNDKASTEVVSNVIVQTAKKGKRNGGNNGENLNKIQAKRLKSEKEILALKEHIPVEYNRILPVVDDPKDFSYESVGNLGILENVWRRPLEKPTRFLNKNIGASTPSPEPLQTPVTIIRRRRKANPVPNRIPTITSETIEKISPLTGNNINEVSKENPFSNLTISDILEMQPLAPPPVFRITKPPLISKGSVENKKVDNLKLCISKLTSARTSVDQSSGSTNSTNSCGSVISSGVNRNMILESTNANTETKRRVRVSKGRKRNSMVPLRFREKLDMENLKHSNEMLVLPPPLPKVKLSKKTKEEFPGSSHHVNEYLRNDKTLAIESLKTDNSFASQVRIPTCSSSIIISELTKDLPTIIKQIEPPKTPVIKITFGTPGNGMIVQIPPKTTHQLENNSDTDSKAVRKALKKAKKEAKKKQLISSTEPSTEDALPLFSAIPYWSSTSTELNRELVNTACEQPDQFPATLAEFEEPLEEFVPKKRKKDKKKKKEKEHKENGFVALSNSRSQYNIIKEPFLSSLAPINEPTPSTLSPPLKQICEPDSSVDTSANSITSNDQSRPTEPDQRICISLKRLATDDYIPWNSPFNDEPESLSDGIEILEPHEFPVNQDFKRIPKSVGFCYHEGSNRSYRNGDVVWGKSIGCPWWPGKIVDIVIGDKEVIWAKVAWYKSTTQSYIALNDLCLFNEFFDTKYIKNKRKGTYQQAVRDAQQDAESLERENLTH